MTGPTERRRPRRVRPRQLSVPGLEAHRVCHYCGAAALPGWRVCDSCYRRLFRRLRSDES